jgi:hypothetical protein
VKYLSVCELKQVCVVLLKFPGGIENPLSPLFKGGASKKFDEIVEFATDMIHSTISSNFLASS